MPLAGGRVGFSPLRILARILQYFSQSCAFILSCTFIHFGWNFCPECLVLITYCVLIRYSRVACFFRKKDMNALQLAEVWKWQKNNFSKVVCIAKSYRNFHCLTQYFFTRVDFYSWCKKSRQTVDCKNNNSCKKNNEWRPSKVVYRVIGLKLIHFRLKVS